MDSIPVHLRITGLTPSNADVDACRAAVSELSTSWGKIKDVGQILAKAASIAESLGGDGTSTSALGDEVQEAVQKQASAFLYSERPLEVGVCAGLAAVVVMKSEPGNSGWTIPDVYSNALWSALAFQPCLSDGKRESLRREVLEIAQSRSMMSADKARERDLVPDPAELTVTIAAENKVTTDFKKAISSTIEALRRNAALDREELDFLWWAQSSRSRLLSRPLAAIPEPTRLVTAAVEAAALLRRLPAEVHRELVLRTVDEDPELDLQELLSVIGNDRDVLSGAIAGGFVAAHPAIFPLLGALTTGTAAGTGALVKRKASTWGGTALLEAALARMMGTGLIKL